MKPLSTGCSKRHAQLAACCQEQLDRGGSAPGQIPRTRIIPAYRGGKRGLFSRSALLNASAARMLFVRPSFICCCNHTFIPQVSLKSNLGEFGSFRVQLKTQSSIQAFFLASSPDFRHPHIRLSLLPYHFVLPLTRVSDSTLEASAVPVPLFDWCYLVITGT